MLLAIPSENDEFCWLSSVSFKVNSLVVTFVNQVFTKRHT